MYILILLTQTGSTVLGKNIVLNENTKMLQ
ncbi:hypothetical protein TH47_05075 [Thalassospira sp. MCCC 1A02803]|nr:hypothetical protein TH47_05075 [Thalassospira sp. MCCC 1A02803]